MILWVGTISSLSSIQSLLHELFVPTESRTLIPYISNGFGFLLNIPTMYSHPTRMVPPKLKSNLNHGSNNNTQQIFGKLYNTSKVQCRINYSHITVDSTN